MWERLDECVRKQVQRFIQALLDDEMSALLGRPKLARRAPGDGPSGLRHGYGKFRRLSVTAGTIIVRRRRVWGVSQRFVCRGLPLLKRGTREVGDFLPTLYLHGLALGDFDLALRGLLGDAAPLSPAALARLKATGQMDYATRKPRRLDDLEVV
jgi:putative transposase